MTEVLFYHLERARLEHILPGLLEKTLARSWRAVVRGTDQGRLQELDGYLWTYKDESFLPHGMMGEGNHPVSLTSEEVLPDGTDILFLTDGAKGDAVSFDGLIRVINIFDGGDSEAVQNARAFWKDVKAADHDATYWRQSPEGRWEKAG